ncbi:MAG: FeoB-associated Cys-rich membrane protein [Atopobiaceae bacterium]|nr:FeoB-associated Cys-rich membrane protein [Atopobiaceae bacterium]
MNIWDVVLGACVALAVAWAIRHMRQTRAAGGCASCPFAEGCARREADACEARHG